jgi:hypothetical protein
MSFELKDWINFPPEENELDKILLWLAVEEWLKWDYRTEYILHFLKTGHWLYYQEDNGIDTQTADAASGYVSERGRIIQKYIQTISFLWQEEENSEVELHIEHTFNDIRWIDISKEIEIWRNQELANLSKATKEVVFNLVDARSLLRNSKIVEFNTPEEVFFFVLDLLWLKDLAAYLNWYWERVVIFTDRRGDLDSIALVTKFISEENNVSGITQVVQTKWLPINKTPDSYATLSSVLKDSSINLKDLRKIKLIQKQS